MRERSGGHIINVSSVGGFAALPSYGQYSATKSALEGLSEALAQEVAPLGIKVMRVEPNGFRTDFLKATSLQRACSQPDAHEATSGDIMRRFVAIDGKQPSDRRRGAEAIIAAVNAEHGPFRLVLGDSGVKRVRDKLATVSVELDAWEHLSTSVSFSE